MQLFPRQEIKNVNQKEKFEHLKLELLEINGSVVLFVKTKRSADKIALKLRKDKFNAEAIHGDLRQSKREKVILINHGSNNFEVTNKMRIAQMVVSKYEKINFKLVSDLNTTKRGSGGFGSTGTK